MSKAIFKFHFDFGRMGELDGVFVATPEEIESILGKQIYFGEVLGKHSEVFTTMEKKFFKKITTDENFIKLFEQYDMSSGYSPFDYLEDSETEEDENE